MDFQEFPKWVYPADKEPLIVETAEEEAAAMGQEPATEKPRRGRPPKVTGTE